MSYAPDNSIILRNHRLDALLERGYQFIEDIDRFNGLDQQPVDVQEDISDIIQDSDIEAMMNSFNQPQLQESEELDAEALAASIDIDKILTDIDQSLQL